MNESITGVTLTPLKSIYLSSGNIYHIMKSHDVTFNGFGEAYLSEINPGFIKGWKKHTKMTLNLTVPYGSVRFVVFDDRLDSLTHGNFIEYTLSKELNYSRLTIMPNLWFAFQCISDSPSVVLNLANIQHDPNEAVSKSLDEISFNWSLK